MLRRAKAGRKRSCSTDNVERDDDSKKVIPLKPGGILEQNCSSRLGAIPIEPEPASRPMMNLSAALALTLVLGAGPAAAADDNGSVLAYHGSADRRGLCGGTGLPAARAQNARLDSGFQAKLNGHLYAQPLLWRGNGGAGILIAA